MKYRYILFDWDGNLADTLPAWLISIKEAYAKYHVFPSDEEIILNSFGKYDSSVQYGIHDIDKFNNELEEIAARTVPKADLFPYAKEVMIELKTLGHKLAIVTTNFPKIIEEALNLHGLEDLIDMIVTGVDVINHKPHPEGVHKILDSFGADKSDAIIIGDSNKDIGAGKAAGITTVVHYPESHSKLYTQGYIDNLGADFVINDFRELLEIVK